MQLCALNQTIVKQSIGKLNKKKLFLTKKGGRFKPFDFVLKYTQNKV